MTEHGWQLREPLWLLLVLAAPLVALVRRRARTGLPTAAAALPLATPLPRTWRTRLAALPVALWFAAVLCAAAAMARPVQRLPLPPERSGIDILLCIDTSSSMAADDLQPGTTRLDAARQFAERLGASRRHDRIGCVRFARYADLVCPPTLDRQAMAELLGRVDFVEADGPEDATAIGAAVALAADTLARSEASSRVLIVLTDGEENVATAATPQEIPPLHAAQWCRGLGVRAHSVVVGRGAPRGDGTFAALDTRAAEELAAATGGRFFAAPDPAALAAVQRAIDALETVPFAEPRTLVREWFAAPLWLAVVLGCLAARLGRRPFGVLE